MEVMTRRMRGLPVVLVVPLLVLVASTGAFAGTIWGNSASSGAMQIEAFDTDTGLLLKSFSPASGNGRGMVVVGNVVYYTRVSDSNIYMLDATTGAPLGSIATSQASMSTIAWDGSHFWTTDYSGSNEAYRIDTAGNTVKTINLPNATGFSDGMEFFDGKLIANRTDGGFGGAIIYDIYDLDGNVLVSNFISSPNGTGIAYDGTNFLVSDIFNNQIHTYNGTTGAFISTLVLDASGSGSRLIEDLSVDYQLVLDIPEPGTIVLLGAGFVGIVLLRRRRRTA